MKVLLPFGFIFWRFVFGTGDDGPCTDGPTTCGDKIVCPVIVLERFVVIEFPDGVTVLINGPDREDPLREEELDELEDELDDDEELELEDDELDELDPVARYASAGAALVSMSPMMKTTAVIFLIDIYIKYDSIDKLPGLGVIWGLYNITIPMSMRHTHSKQI